MTVEEGPLSKYARTGSAEDFRVLVDQYGAMVFSVCRQTLGASAAAQDAEDAAQAVFLALLQKTPFLKAREQHLALWLHRAAIYAARQIRRSEARRNRREQEATVVRLAISNESEATLAEVGSDLQEAVDSLPQRYREAIVLRYYSGRSAAEIAKLINRPQRTVEQRITAGLAKLRLILQKRKTISATALPFLLENFDKAIPDHLLGSIQSACFPPMAGALGALSASGTPAVLAKEVLRVFFHVQVKSALLFGGALALGLSAIVAVALHPSFKRNPADANRSGSENADETTEFEKLRVRWTFEHGPAVDLAALCGAWRWERAHDGQGVMVNDALNPEEAVFVALPVKIAPRPFCVTTKSRPTKPERTYHAFVSWADENKMLSCRGFFPNKFTLPETAEPDSIVRFVFGGKHMIAFMDGEPRQFVEYPAAYPTARLVLALQGVLLELELRSLDAEESREFSRLIDKLQEQNAAAQSEPLFFEERRFAPSASKP
jgi:RNA polymerase sigma factor (sigma-70 family)